MSRPPFGEGWTPALREELERNSGDGRVGSRLVSETGDLRVWHIELQPGERLPFHRHVLDYSWTVLTDGRARSRYGDGHIDEIHYRAGDSRHLVYGPGESMIHDLENIGDTTLIFTTVESLRNGNRPLPLDRPPESTAPLTAADRGS